MVLERLKEGKPLKCEVCEKIQIIFVLNSYTSRRIITCAWCGENKKESEDGRD